MSLSLVTLSGGKTGIFAKSSWTFHDGEQWAVMGPNGSGKSLLCGLVAGAVPAPYTLALDLAPEVEGHVALLSFAQQQAESRANGWLQARYYSDDDAESVKDFLSYDKIFEVNPFEIRPDDRKERRAFAVLFEAVVRLLGIRPLLGRAFIQLSNGETRRVLLARALLKKPRLLVLDDPAAGLDPDQRAKLRSALDALAHRGVAMLLAVRHPDELPSCVDHLLTLDRCRIVKSAKTRVAADASCPAPAGSLRGPSTGSHASGGRSAAPAVIALKDIDIDYGNRHLFEHFSWTVRRGERWVLRGPNGCGKTTLLSLISGDNPKAYANDVTVFGQHREPGESLWAIRRRIGTVSPEQQSYFDPQITVMDAVLAGRMTEEGTIARPRPKDRARARGLLRALGIPASAAEKAFGLLSSGAQRLVLVARALESEPDLLLLDEPCMNLDEGAARRFLAKIAAYLRGHRELTAVCVAHRASDVPAGFRWVLDLSGGVR